MSTLITSTLTLTAVRAFPVYDIKVVRIDDTITTIQQDAFKYCDNLTTVMFEKPTPQQI